MQLLFFNHKYQSDLTLKIFVCLIIINVTYWKLPILIIGKNLYFWQFIFKNEFLDIVSGKNREHEK